MAAPRPTAGQLRPTPVAAAVAVFLVAGFIVLTVVGVLLALAQRRAAVAEAVRDARTVTSLEAHDVVGPALTSEALVPGPAYDALDRIVRERVLGDLIVRVKIWDETGRVVYSDDSRLVGRTFPLPEDELAALRSGETTAEVSDLGEDENLDERQFGKLLQVYLGVRTPTGQQLLFETYQPYDVIRDSSRRMLLTSLPVLLGGLVLLYLVQAPLAYRMASRLRAVQDEREQLLVASLAAQDRERASIAADLHDGVVQGMAGASYSLTATASAARAAGQERVADAVLTAAGDLRRWVRELRSLVVTITPPALHSHGLAASLADLAAPLESRGIVVSVEAGDDGSLDEPTEALVYRVAQEAVRNIVRHAGAGRVELSLSRTPGRGGVDELVLRVADDGRGFDPSAPGARGRGSVGLDLLRALVSGQQGQLDVTAEPGHGTTVVLRLSVPAAVRTGAPA
jgi:two-component system, NarL family, sensor kinase